MNKTIKIIDLLNKIANGEINHNTQFRYKNKTFTYRRYDINKFDSETIVDENCIKLFSGNYNFNLDDYVEIIEDEDENRINIYNIKELKVEQVMGENLEDTEFDQYYINGFHIGSQGDELTYAIRDMALKINEIIEQVNKLKEVK